MLVFGLSICLYIGDGGGVREGDTKRVFLVIVMDFFKGHNNIPSSLYY
jgi:hypothetical protein